VGKPLALGTFWTRGQCSCLSIADHHSEPFTGAGCEKWRLYSAAPERKQAERSSMSLAMAASPKCQISSLSQVQLAPGDSGTTANPASHACGALQGPHDWPSRARQPMVTAPDGFPGAVGLCQRGSANFWFARLCRKDAVALQTRVIKSNLSPFPLFCIWRTRNRAIHAYPRSSRFSVELVTEQL